jgi:hypothetical protein
MPIYFKDDGTVTSTPWNFLFAPLLSNAEIEANQRDDMPGVVGVTTL